MAIPVSSRPVWQRLLSARFLVSPPVLLVIYVLYLGATLVAHYLYYCVCYTQCWLDLACGPSVTPATRADWFGAAFLDNYQFIGILVFPMLIAYVQLTERLDADFRDMVATLAARGVLRALPEGAARSRALRPARPEAVRELEGIRTGATRRGLLLAAMITPGVSAFIVVALGNVMDAMPDWYLITLGIFIAPLAIPPVFIAVSRLGRVFCYGLVVLRHRRYGVEPQPILEHSDRAGGLKPLGDYSLAQTYRIGLISAFLILMTLFLLLSGDLDPRMHGIGHGEMHQDLFRGISVLTVFVLLIQVPSLLLPLWTVHARMIEFKRGLIGRAAVMTRRRQRVLALLEAKQRAGQGVAAERAQLEVVERWIDNYEAFPAWPIPNQSLRNFWILWGGAIGTAISMLISAIAGRT